MIATVAIASTMVMSDPSASALLAGAGVTSESQPDDFDSRFLGLVCSVIGIFVVRMRSTAAPEQALRNGHQLSAILLMQPLWLTTELGLSLNVLWAIVAGALGGMAVGLSLNTTRLAHRLSALQSLGNRNCDC